MKVSAQTTLTEAKDWLRAQLPKGARCPCCNQHVQVYRRPMYGTLARALIACYLAGGTDRYVHSSDLGITLRGGEMGKLAYFQLVVEERAQRPDGGRTGYWRVTPLGADWLFGRRKVSKYAWVYDGQVRGYDGPMVSVADVLDEPFDLRSLSA